MSDNIDITQVEYPEHPNDMPKDSSETFDLVVRKGPISHAALMNQVSVYSSDEVYSHLSALIEGDYLTRRSGDIDQDGTTRDVYEVHPSRVDADPEGEDA